MGGREGFNGCSLADVSTASYYNSHENQYSPNQGFESGRLWGRFRFRQNVVIFPSPPTQLSTFLEAAATANRFRFRFQNSSHNALRNKGLVL